MTNGDATISLQPFSWYSKIQDIELSRSLIWTYLYKGNNHICYQHAVPGINKSYIQIYNCRSVRKSRMKLLDSSATRLHTSYDYIQESRWVRGTKTAGTVWCSGLLRCSHWTLTTKACKKQSAVPSFGSYILKKKVPENGFTEQSAIKDFIISTKWK